MKRTGAAKLKVEKRIQFLDKYISSCFLNSSSSAIDILYTLAGGTCALLIKGISWSKPGRNGGNSFGNFKRSGYFSTFS